MIFDRHIFVCTNQRGEGEKRSCGEKHGHDLVSEFKKRIKDQKIGLSIRTNRSGCLGICDLGQTVAVYPEGVFYVGVEKEDVDEIIREHIIGGRPVERLRLKSWKK